MTRDQYCARCATPIMEGITWCRTCWEHTRALADERHPHALIEAERPTT